MGEAKVYVPLKEAVEALKKQLADDDEDYDFPVEWSQGWTAGNNSAIMAAIHILSYMSTSIEVE